MKTFSEVSVLCARFDLESYLEDHQFRKLSNAEWVGDCPHCMKEQKVAVNVESRRWHCWVCQDYEDYWDAKSGTWRRRCTEGGGGVVKLVRWLEECEFKEALQIISGKQNWIVGSIQKLDANIEYIEDVLDTDACIAIDPPEGWAPINGRLPYLDQRNISDEDVIRYGLFWTPEGRYRNRLVFPVWEDSRLVYWQARAMWESDSKDFTKAMNPKRPRDDAGNPLPGYAVSAEVLMNLDQAATYSRVALVEGPMDVIRTGPDSVCTFGKALSHRQVSRLVRKGVRAVDLMWDADAHEEMLDVMPQLSLFFDTRLVFLERGDPGDHTQEQLNELRASATHASQLSRTAWLD